MIELQEDNLQQIVAENDKVIVQFGATWCGNCRIVKPKFKRLAGENSDFQFVYADAEKFPGVKELADVNYLPTFAGFKGGKLIAQQSGNKEEVIKHILNEVANN